MVELLRRFSEWRAENKAKKEFETWQTNHPKETRILELLDEENRHALIASYNSRRAQLLEAAQNERRRLGLRDELIEYVIALPFRMEDRLAHDLDFARSPEEAALMREINHGFLLRSGALTPGCGRPIGRKPF